MLRLFSTPLLLMLSLGASSVGAAVSIPVFTPNVVDPDGYLRPVEVQAINTALERIRGDADIWGAVYVLKNLRGVAIEELAEKAFHTWKLGQQGRDNGLLLVLAMEDRKSRFEVGYGLEGDLPDVIARRALDDVARPRMRQDQIKEAIVQSFIFMAKARAAKGDVERFIPPEPDPAWTSVGEHFWKRGILAYGLFLALLWLVTPVAILRGQSLGRRLVSEVPDFQLDKEPSLLYGRVSKQLLWGPSGGGGALLRLFFTVNPGVFIYLGAAFVSWLCFLFVAIFALIAVLIYRHFTRRFSSAEAYQAYIEAQRRANARQVAKGYKRETRPGVFEYTQAWYSSDEYRTSRSRSSSSSGSSSSSSSGSSSSGGGSSGGGGSSSSW